jgi:hypothetical protein
MTYSIDQLKGEVSRGGGFAKGNLYRVILPVIPELYINLTGVDVTYPQSLNILCKNVTLPGKQLTTVNRTVGVVSQKIAYGYAVEDVSMTFLGLNDYIARKYFENWQSYALNPNTNEVRYKNEYAKTVTIQQLDKYHRVVYSVDLEKAFPTQLLNIDFSNDNSSAVDINVTLSYSKWKRNDVITDAVSTEAQKFLEKILLK